VQIAILGDRGVVGVAPLGELAARERDRRRAHLRDLATTLAGELGEGP
jgi:hypothetical protein